MNRDRFRFFHSSHLESDLLIGVPHSCFKSEMRKIADMELVRLRKVLEKYIADNPLFGTSLEPLPVPGSASIPVSREDLPYEIKTMLLCSERSGTGPMSSVAGLFAEKVADRLTNTFGMGEIIVENGGDLYIRNQSNLISVIHAGNSSISDKMAFIIKPGCWGVCTSSGTMGHSFSKGKADALTVIAKSAALADAWATSLANQVNGSRDIDPMLERVANIEEILGIAVIVGDKIGMRGEFELKLLS